MSIAFHSSITCKNLLKNEQGTQNFLKMDKKGVYIAILHVKSTKLKKLYRAYGAFIYVFMFLLNPVIFGRRNIYVYSIP